VHRLTSRYRKQDISGQEINMQGNGHAEITAVAELLARRWKEDRPYFTLHGITPEVGLHPWWIRGRAFFDQRRFYIPVPSGTSSEP
jgi:hypothetical protein